MKKKMALTLIAGLILSLLAGCGSRDMDEKESAQAEYTAVAEAQENEPANLEESERVLEICFKLLGRDDASAATLLDGGTENFGADGTMLIGRLYSASLFGETTEVGTLYDQDGLVSVITMQLKNPVAAFYAKQLREIYGEPAEINDTPSESGSTWESWRFGEAELRLYQAYGLAAVEIMSVAEESGMSASDTDKLFTGWLPQSVTRMMSETEEYELLRQAIIDYYEIPEAYWEQTKYYYNYVDLNGDGTNEIIAVIMGSYTSGSGGDSALWCQEYDGKMQIWQAFTLVNAPIIVTKEATNGQQYGSKGLILQRRGGGAETEIVQLTCSDGMYQNVADAESMDSIDGIEGTAIICNNLIEDMENGNYLTLGK